MKQVIVYRRGVSLVDVPAPTIEPGSVLIEVAYSLISSGTEMTTVEGATAPLLKQAIAQPNRIQQVVEYARVAGVKKAVARIRGTLEQGVAVGYSCSGTVLKVGEGVGDLKPGDRVACAGGGAAVHAELVLVPRNLVVPIPDGCDIKAAASVALGGIAMQGIRRAAPQLGEFVAVIGLGLVGQLTVQLLREAGCRVLGLDIDERRVQVARQLGANVALTSSGVDLSDEVRHFTDGHGVDSTIITASSESNAIVQQAMAMTRRKGRVVVVGAVGLGLKRSPFYEKEIDLLISCSYGPGRYDGTYEKEGLDYPYAYVRWTENRNMAEYLRVVAEGRLRTDLIIEREYDVADAPAAYQALTDDADRPIGIVLRYLGAGQREEPDRPKTAVVLRERRIAGRIGVAVVGAGSFATGVHLPNLQELTDLYELRAVVSRTGSTAREVAARFGAAYATTSFEDVLADPTVDAVVICTRHHLHAAQVVAALSHGKHVYVEKPLSLSAEELQAILGVYGLSLHEFEEETEPALPESVPVLTVGYNRRFSSAVARIKEATGQRSSPLVATYRVNAGYVPREHWVHGPEGGGRIIGEACHMVDFLNFLVGAPVESVGVKSLVSPHDQGSSTDNVAITSGYTDGSVSTLVYTSLGARGLGKELVEIHVDGKSIVLDDFRSLRLYTGAGAGSRTWTVDKGHKQALKAFADSLKGGGTAWPVRLSELVRVSQITMLASGRPWPDARPDGGDLGPLDLPTAEPAQPGAREER